MTKGGADVMAFVVGGKFSVEESKPPWGMMEIDDKMPTHTVDGSEIR